MQVRENPKGLRASQVALVVKKPLANTENVTDAGSIPGLGRSPGGGRGNPFQYSCLENPMDRGAWQAIVQRVKKSWIRLKGLKKHTLSPGSRKAMTNLDSILKSREITLSTKVHLVKVMVFPVVTYGYESLTIKKAECRRIDAFEL